MATIKPIYNLQSSYYFLLYRKVFDERLKECSDTDEWHSSDDRVFHVSGPDVHSA